MLHVFLEMNNLLPHQEKRVAMPQPETSDGIGERVASPQQSYTSAPVSEIRWTFSVLSRPSGVI